MEQAERTTNIYRGNPKSIWGFHSLEFIQGGLSPYSMLGPRFWELGSGIALCFNGQCWFCIYKCLPYFFVVNLTGFILFCFVLMFLKSALGLTQAWSFPSILLEKPTHASVVCFGTVSQMFWSFGKHGVHNWEHLRCSVSEMIVLSAVLHERSISPIISFLSPLQPPFWRGRALPFLDKQLLVLQPLRADPQTQHLLLLLIEGIRPGFARIPSRGQNPHKTSLPVSFCPPHSREGSRGHFIIWTPKRTCIG